MHGRQRIYFKAAMEEMALYKLKLVRTVESFYVTKRQGNRNLDSQAHVYISSGVLLSLTRQDCKQCFKGRALSENP